MRVEHPQARQITGVVDDYVDVNGVLVPVDDDGTFELPDGADQWFQEWAAQYDVDPDELRVTGRCEVVKSDGEVCGRELPCQYHSDDESDASSSERDADSETDEEG